MKVEVSAAENKLLRMNFSLSHRSFQKLLFLWAKRYLNVVNLVNIVGLKPLSCTQNLKSSVRLIDCYHEFKAYFRLLCLKWYSCNVF